MSDALGSVRQIFNASGEIILVESYQPYGETLNSYGDGASPYGFAGEYTDSQSGLQYLRARYYAPGVGRFLTVDLRDGEPIKPMTYNPWLYVYANPINLTDPSGLDPNCKNPWPWACAHRRLLEIVDENWPNGAEALVQVFEDQELYTEWGMAAGLSNSQRLEWLLAETRGGEQHVEVIGGVVLPIQFAIHFGSDCGFNEEFRDSQLYPQWGKASIESNQVGHFLTAVALAYYKAWATENLGLRLIIGHEKISDTEGPVDQLLSATDTDISNWYLAVQFDEEGNTLMRDNALQQILDFDPKKSIPFEGADPSRVGNSLQDLRLSLKGYRFANWVHDNSWKHPQTGGAWLRFNLGIYELTP